MVEPESVSPDVLERLAKLEAQVAWLSRQMQDQQAQSDARRATGPLPVRPTVPVVRPAPPRPPKPPSKPISSIVWVAGAGSILFLIGAIFFLHWSIQQGWVGPELRFLLGLAAGGGLSFGAARLLLGKSPKLGVALLLAGLGTLLFTFRWGAFDYHFYPPTLGLAAMALSTLLAGGLSARAKSGGALCVAVVMAALSPLVFSQGGHHEVALMVYLAVLMGAALLVPYLAKIGAQWGVARVVTLALIWLLMSGCVTEGLSEEALTRGLLLILHFLLAGLWVWLPRQAEPRPKAATLLWLLVCLAFGALAWSLWRQLGWAVEAFSLPILALAALNIALVKPVRARLEHRGADVALLALILGGLALAVPVALAWKWVGPIWGLFALGLAAALYWGERRGDQDAGMLRHLVWMTLAMTIVATLRWAFHGLEGLFGVSHGFSFGFTRTPFFNGLFLEGLFTAGAWALLALRSGSLRAFGFVGLQIVGGFALSLELAYAAGFAGQSARAEGLVLTLAWGLLGALQWLRSLSETRQELRLGLAVAGYAWLGLASIKLLTVDLSQASVPIKALAFLGVGAMILVAALVGNRLRLARKEDE